MQGSSIALRILFAGAVLLAGLSIAIGAEDSRFARTVLALETAEIQLRARFARAALFELGEAYLAEAELARAEAETSEQGPRLIAWSRAVSHYADGLFRLLDEIEQGASVSLRLNDKEVPSVATDGRTVMLAHPRRVRQAEYENRVLDEFCTGTTCRALTAGAEQEAIPVSATTITPDWLFTESGPACHYRGIRVSFPSREQLVSWKALCRQLMQELEMLATEIAWQQRHGVNVHWDGIRIQSTPGKTEHLVTLNSAGDALLITLPLMQSSPGLLLVVTPWLQQRFDPGGPPSLDIVAAEQGWD